MTFYLRGSWNLDEILIYDVKHVNLHSLNYKENMVQFRESACILSRVKIDYYLTL